MTLQVDFIHSVTSGMSQQHQLVNLFVSNTAAIPVIEHTQQQTLRTYTRT
jgi:hypothetical protein